MTKVSKEGEDFARFLGQKHGELEQRVAGLEATVTVLIERIAQLEAWKKAEQEKTRTGLRFS